MRRKLDRNATQMRLKCGHQSNPTLVAMNDAKKVRGRLGASGEVVGSHFPLRSLIYLRMNRIGQGRMPHIASTVIDEPAVLFVKKWIEAIGNSPLVRHDLRLPKWGPSRYIKVSAVSGFCTFARDLLRLSNMIAHRSVAPHQHPPNLG